MSAAQTQSEGAELGGSPFALLSLLESSLHPNATGARGKNERASRTAGFRKSPTEGLAWMQGQGKKEETLSLQTASSDLVLGKTRSLRQGTPRKTRPVTAEETPQCEVPFAQALDTHKLAFCPPPAEPWEFTMGFANPASRGRANGLRVDCSWRLVSRPRPRDASGAGSREFQGDCSFAPGAEKRAQSPRPRQGEAEAAGG